MRHTLYAAFLAIMLAGATVSSCTLTVPRMEPPVSLCPVDGGVMQLPCKYVPWTGTA